jgi:hypothetical protein
MKEITTRAMKCADNYFESWIFFKSCVIILYHAHDRKPKKEDKFFCFLINSCCQLLNIY